MSGNTTYERSMTDNTTHDRSMFDNTTYARSISDTATYDRSMSDNTGIPNPVGSTVVIRVPSQGSLCGFKLTVGDQYLLSGSRNRKTRTITSTTCGNFLYKEEDVTFEQMIYLFTSGSYSYRKNCSCKEIINPRHEPGVFDESKGCKLPEELNADLDCYDKTGLCKREGGVCKWKNVDC
ncbi:unnamed protein product [Mytilus coruscus]|uniref:NTR domain-containing protein n=1 Tax=Mytilus coruscus TaxID=42192 RepID=A0A6J8EMW7_MYTCO|nr:unnamed protein product [Mytilus coruscus]